MRVLAPAKINLHLRVGKPRADGFHPILSWMCTVKLFDTLVLDRLSGGEISFECDDPTVPCDERNLVVKTAIALADSVASSREGEQPIDFGLGVKLHKRIPSGAGLGGGSSDGARALQALNKLWHAGRNDRELAALAAELGSDLPFFFFSPAAICRGRGEEVEKFEPPLPRAALLVLPGRAMRTGQVYGAFDDRKLGDDASISREPDWKAWASLPALELLPLLVNDLEAAAFAIDPGLGLLRQELERLIGRNVRMSGSGSSLFSLFDEMAEARWAASLIMQRQTVRALAVEIAPMIEDDLS